VVVFFVKSNENTYPKGRALTQMYRVVPITKRGNTLGAIESEKSCICFDWTKNPLTFTRLYAFKE